MNKLLRVYHRIIRHIVVVTRDLVINNFLDICIVSEIMRRSIYRLFGMKIGISRIRPNCFFEGYSLNKL